MWLGGVSVFGSFAARYSSEAALCGNTRNICHKQTPSRYDWKTVESDVKHHSLIHSLPDDHAYNGLGGPLRFSPYSRRCLRGIYIQSSQDADLFNVAHFKAKSKSTQVLVRELLFADDSDSVAHTPEQMQQILDAFSAFSWKFGLQINIKNRNTFPTR